MSDTVSSTANVIEIRKCLESIIDPKECVLCFDQNLVEQLPSILKEFFEINSNMEIHKNPALSKLVALLGAEKGDASCLDILPKLIIESGVDPDEYSMVASAEELRQYDEEFDHWTETEASAGCESVLTLQKDLGMGRWNAGSSRYDARKGEATLRDYLRSVTSPPASLVERAMGHSYWALMIKWWKLTGRVDGDNPTLSIGPRWITEIEYFRKILGLRQHVGLDLFSDDEDLVVAGDMHEMPFPDSHFSLVFLKNVADKSYDIRRLVSELIRASKSGGTVIVDQVCGYGDVSPLTRTDIQRAGNLLRIFQAKARIDVLVCKDIDISSIGDRSTNNARLAVRIWK